MTDQTFKTDGVVDVDGTPHLRDAKGALMPLKLVKATDMLIHEQVCKVVGFASALSEQIARFKVHAYADLAALDAMLAQEYEVKIGGKKGNKTYFSYDGCKKIEVRINDLIDFGPELHSAKALIDECLNDWSEGSRPEIRAIVTRAFNTDKEGQINRGEIFMLLKLDIEDERWLRAMKAVKEAIRVIGAKEYIRFGTRDTFDGEWTTISINIAQA
ncbi:hypothetical protein AQS8620_01445 [Aquimixticola soesokkakensis]|uniref:Sulfate transporter n=1 Tax=Aquimixticola soesokkakensis TaxID=1519096 RepID=A0A1Y5SEU1_9RHOB|nr:DUF3164 family protein [Aquimixticola soesokkakensis]SLN38381.1 hypothetical protein AQS8620_01445 [Aquimixticola soesokkakensis]